ncbi:unnamed protein product, partial [Meganyctiphanes norvegica]
RVLHTMFLSSTQRGCVGLPPIKMTPITGCSLMPLTPKHRTDLESLGHLHRLSITGQSLHNVPLRRAAESFSSLASTISDNVGNAYDSEDDGRSVNSAAECDMQTRFSQSNNKSNIATETNGSSTYR